MKNLILLHGALGSSDDLSPLANELRKHNLAVYPLSFSGHGKTPFHSNFSIPQFANELHSFIIEKKLEDVAVFGYSMGGYVALFLASQQSHLINKIITLGTKFNWSEETVLKETSMLNPPMMLEKIPGFVKLLEDKHGSAWKNVVLKTASLMQDIGEKKYLTKEVLSVLKQSVLIGLADKDQMVSLDETLLVYKTIANAGMYMLPKTKHQLESVNVELLSILIHDFIF